MIRACLHLVTVTSARGIHVLGFEIIVSREAPGPQSETVLASWRVGFGGLGWLDALVAEGKAVFVAGNQGYPVHYTAVASAVLAILANGPPEHPDPVLRNGPVYGISDAAIDRAALLECPPDEQLTIQAWDLSS
jgi:hypothetical protein